MWANLQEEIRQKAELLRSFGYENTGKWCEHILRNLSQYTKSPQMLRKDCDDLFSAFKQEFLGRTDLGDRKLREKYLTIVQALLEGAIRDSPDPKEMFYELVPFMDQGLNTSRATNEMVRVFGDLGEQFIEARMYASLFVFMLYIEGRYFPTIRMLCGLRIAAKGENASFQTIHDMEYADIKRELGNLGKPLFLVYDDLGRKLRNAVAHANFRYEQGKLICWNIHPRTRKETWRKDFTYDELSTTLIDIYSISHAYLFWYMLRELVDKIALHVGHHEVEQ